MRALSAVGVLMRCTVLLFAQLAESVGEREILIDLPDRATVRDALDRLAALHAPIADLIDRIAVAVNERYQPTTAQLTDGCTIALIPPVSGG